MLFQGDAHIIAGPSMRLMHSLQHCLCLCTLLMPTHTTCVT
jgi:hypothetical protein